MRRMPRVVGRTAVIALLLLAVFPTLRAQEPIQKKSCDLPAALKGVSGHVLMRYTINREGLVNFVEPVFSRVEPAARSAEVIGHLKSCLSEWKYAPGDTSGWAKAYLELLLAFHYFRPTPAPQETVTLPGGRKVPRSWMAEMRQMKIDLGDELLKGPLVKELSGDGWSLKTNVKPAERTPLSHAIQEAEETFSSIFPGKSEAEGPPMVVLVFGERDQFTRVAAFDNLFVRFTPGGEYLPEERIAYTFASKSEGPLRMSLDYLRHEVTHHLVYQRLAGGRGDPPYWVNEGIASLIELLRPRKKGEVDRFRFQRGGQAEGAYSWRSKSDDFIGAFEKAAAAQRLPDPAAFLRGEMKEMPVDLAYGLSWIVVHYLLNAEQGQLQAPFVRWMTTTMGTADDPGLAKALGRTPEHIFSALPAHVESMKRGG
jgi:hypothetical protein